MNKKQVDKSHYEFSRYMDKARWSSIWHQVDEVAKLKPTTVLEIGPGAGIFKNACAAFDIKVETIDLDPDLGPNHVGSATDLPFEDGTYDVVCAFQVLEHLPYADSLIAFSEMARVARRNVVISLPDAKKIWWYRLHIPKFGELLFSIPRPFSRPVVHEFDGEHFWEINKIDFPLPKVVDDFSEYMPLLKTYRVANNPYHRFFVFGV
jgi:SAM-dependent methyltransferase